MSNKVFVLAPNEDWIVDRFVKEWYEDNADISEANIAKADVIWALADWCFERIPKSVLWGKKVLVTVHHLVPEKFNARERMLFQLRDDIVDAYHVPNKYTRDFVQTLTSKPINIIPYWANQKIWKQTADKNELHKLYGLNPEAYLIGSFQRDTEGSDLISPKLEKGPDLLADAIIELARKAKDYFDIEVVLAGWRRQYIMKRLGDAKIKYKYFERPSQKVINDLYQTLHLYPITARYEGGPQALIECGLHGIPVISRQIGMADEVLPSKSINDDVTKAIPEVPNVEHLKLPNGYVAYRKLIASL